MNTITHELASLEQVEQLRWMFSPFAPGRDEFTLAKVKTTYDIMSFADRGCSLSPSQIHAYLSEIQPMTKSAHREITSMMTTY